MYGPYFTSLCQHVLRPTRTNRRAVVPFALNFISFFEYPFLRSCSSSVLRLICSFVAIPSLSRIFLMARILRCGNSSLSSIAADNISLLITRHWPLSLRFLWALHTRLADRLQYTGVMTFPIYHIFAWFHTGVYAFRQVQAPLPWVERWFRAATALFEAGLLNIWTPPC